MARKKTTKPDPRQLDSGIRVDLKTLANELRQRTEERDAIAFERGRISNQLKLADEAVAHATAAIVAASWPGQMPLISTAPAAKDNASSEADIGDQPDGETVLSGTSGAPLDGNAYPMVPSDTNPAECICGWEIASPIAGHDRRHAQFLRATGDVDEAAVPPARPTKLAGTKKRSSAPPRSKAKKGGRR